MKDVVKRARFLARFFYLIIVIGLVACQAGVTGPSQPLPTHTPAPIETQTPTATLQPPAGVLWVDTTQDNGIISKYVLGMNHGPWSDFNPFSMEKAGELGVTFLRWPGGSWGDRNDVQTYQIDMYIVEARKIGAEPSITVRLTGSTPEKASALVRYVNIEKGYGVKYWAIGNEPDLYVTADQSWNAERYAKQWRDFATAMKAVDPTISFYGPDISNFVGDADKFDPLELLYVNSQKINETKRDYLIEFLKVNADLVNIVTVHRYPFPKKSSDGLPTWEQLRDNTAEWDRIIPNLRRVIKETTGKDYPVGVMEYNSHTSNSAGASTSPDSFYNALWVADIYGRMIRQRPEMQAYWLVKNNDAGHGLLTSFAVRPPYYAFAMWKKFGNHLLTANSDTQYVSVYAAKAEDGAVTVMLINLNGTETRKPLQLNGGDQLKLAEAFLFDAEHNAEAITPPEFKNGDGIVLPAESVMLLIFR